MLPELQINDRLLIEKITYRNRSPMKGEIVVLQPRKVAARMLARRVAGEMGCRLGEEIGYQVRFEKMISDKREWVVTIRSAGNVILGEGYVYAFPEAFLNKNIVQKGEVIASINISNNEISKRFLQEQIKFLFSLSNGFKKNNKIVNA